MKLNRIFTAATVAAILTTTAPRQANAVPAYPHPIQVTQADGTKLTIQRFGDEHGHYTVTSDNRVVVDVNGIYHYGIIGDDGNLKSSGVRATATPTAAEKQFLSSLDNNLILETCRTNVKSRAAKSRVAKAPCRATSATTTDISGTLAGNEGLVYPNFSGMTSTTFPSHGKQKAIVILIQYQDVKFTISNPHDYFERMLNEKGFNDNGCNGSAHDYFLNASNGDFDCDFDLYGPITLSKDMSYYGGNDIYGQDQRPHMMVIEACRQLDETVDFTQYDRDGDGLIDNVFVFYAGLGEASGGGESTIWPHSSDIRYRGNYTFDGVQLSNYACSNEWVTYPAVPRADAIGTFCHEFSHVLGLPDLYETSDTGKPFTPGDWTILDSGCYNNDGLCPPTYTSFERVSMGWLEPVVITDAMDCTLNSIQSNQAYAIPTERSTEFFLLENRQQTGDDLYIPWHGMLVWHIDFNSKVWDDNDVNNTASHQYVDLVEANNQSIETTTAMRRGNPFPGSRNVTSFTAETRPALTSWSGKAINLPITDIAESADGVITFKVAGGNVNIDKAVMRPATDVTPRSFTAHWNAVENARSYIVTITDEAGKALTGWDKKNVGNTTQLTVEGLEPATTYIITVAAQASAQNIGETSDPLTVTTGSLTFEYIIPTAHDATLSNGTTFNASWDPVDGATSYILDVYSKEAARTDNITLTFDDFDSMGLPDGWITTATKIYTVVYYKEKPALRVSRGQYIQSPEFDGTITEVSFWNQTTTAGIKNTIRIDFLVDGEWLNYDFINPTSTASTFTITDVPEGANCVRLLYDGQSSADLALDDLSITYASGSVNVAHPAYNALNVGNVTSFPVDAIDSNKQYYYTVKAHNGTASSLASNEVLVTIPSGISDILASPADGSTRYYNLQGIEVAPDNLTTGIYIVKSAGKTSKMIVK